MNEIKPAGGQQKWYSFRRDWRVPFWAKFLLFAAVVCVVVGALVPLVMGGGGGAGQGGSSALAGNGAGVGVKADEPWLVEQSPWMWRAGLSFGVAYAAAYVLRAAIKIGLIVVGVAVLAGVGLQKWGVLDVNWKEVERKAETVAGEVQERTEKELMALLPSAGAGGLGFSSGFFRRRG